MGGIGETARRYIEERAARDRIEADLAAGPAHERALLALRAAVRQLDEAWHGGGDHEAEHRALCDAWDALLLAPGPNGTSTKE